MTKLYTIGSTQKSASDFFGSLRTAGVRRLLDIRLGGASQLAGFTKRAPGDLDYLLNEICHATYVHLPDLAPTKDLVDALRHDDAFWPTYKQRFIALLRERRAIEKLDRTMFDEPCCLLCTEPTPEHCHRRLVAEAIKRRWPEIEIVHLVTNNDTPRASVVNRRTRSNAG